MYPVSLPMLPATLGAAEKHRTFALRLRKPLPAGIILELSATPRLEAAERKSQPGAGGGWSGRLRGCRGGMGGKCGRSRSGWMEKRFT